MKRIVFVLLALVGSVSAFELEFGLATHHWISEGVNNDNELIGIHWRGIEVGTMLNSYRDRSYILGYRFDLGGGFSLSVGTIHGYRDNAKVYPVRIKQTVFYPSFNYTQRIHDQFSIRVRQMAEVTMISGVVGF